MFLSTLYVTCPFPESKKLRIWLSYLRIDIFLFGQKLNGNFVEVLNTFSNCIMHILNK